MIQPRSNNFPAIPETRQGQQINAGGAGTVYADTQRADMVLKILKPPHRTADMEAKLHAMLSSPPANQTFSYQGRTMVQIAWPQELVVGRRGEFVGFTMRRLDVSVANELFCWMHPGERQQLGFSKDDRLRVNLAANLAAALGFLHSVGHAFVDLKGPNVMAYRDLGYVCLIDCDGFRIKHQNRIFPADLYTPNYLAPEFQAAARAGTLNKIDIGEEQDRFALAVLVFELLDNATHPFSGRDLLNPQGAPTTADLIFQQRSFLDPSSGLAPPANSHATFFHDETLRLLREGLLGPASQRPSAQDWCTHLKDLVTKQMQPCTVPDHWGYGKGCPWCAARTTQSRSVSMPGSGQIPPPAPTPLPISNSAWPTGSGHAGVGGSSRGHSRWAAPVARFGTVARKHPIAFTVAALLALFVMSRGAIASAWQSIPCLWPQSCQNEAARLPSDVATELRLAAARVNAHAAAMGAYAPDGWAETLASAQSEVQRLQRGGLSDGEIHDGLAHVTSVLGQLDRLWLSERQARQAIGNEIQAATSRLRAQIDRVPRPAPADWQQTQSSAEHALDDARRLIAAGARTDARRQLSRALADIDRLTRASATADATPPRPQFKTDSPPPPDKAVRSTETGPAQPAVLPVANEPPPELTQRFSELRIRAQVIAPRLDGLRERQRQLGLDLRADMATADLQMNEMLHSAGAAIDSGRWPAATQALNAAAAAIDKLERFLNIRGERS